jgi:hypothetical protein
MRVNEKTRDVKITIALGLYAINVFYTVRKGTNF